MDKRNSSRICSVDGCDGKHKAKGLCHKHYRRLLIHGDASITSREYHGKRKTLEYGVWCGMIGRCENPNNPKYPMYGGRGITVCEPWRNSFSSFSGDMGEKPSPSHSLDRIENDGNYEPGNCRWADKTIQSINRRVRASNKSGYTGVHFSNATGKWASNITIYKKRIHLGFFAKLEDAVSARKDGEKKYHDI